MIKVIGIETLSAGQVRAILDVTCLVCAERALELQLCGVHLSDYRGFLGMIREEHSDRWRAAFVAGCRAEDEEEIERGRDVLEEREGR